MFLLTYIWPSNHKNQKVNYFEIQLQVQLVSSKCPVSDREKWNRSVILKRNLF